MRALTYQSSREVQVETVPDPVLQQADDIILKVGATAICGSDLHIYRGKIPNMKRGDILGHEFMGEVVETGSAVHALQRGDRVVVPFVIACGACFFCDRQLYSACETTNPSKDFSAEKYGMRSGAAFFGFSHQYGGVPGGQAEYVRVPKANTGPIKIPDTLSNEQVLFLSDILPTGYQAVLNSGVGQGGTLAIFGAGPVGCMAAACARALGVETIYLVDHHPYRLEFARATYGVIPVNFDEVDVAAFLIESCHGRGVDAVIDAVGFEAKGSTLDTVMANLKIEGSSGQALRQCIAAVRRGGAVSVPGVYAGLIHGFAFGDMFEKGLALRTGQTHVQRYMPELLRMIEEGRLHPNVIISHRMPLDSAAEAYRLFDQKEDNCRKVVLTPS